MTDPDQPKAKALQPAARRPEAAKVVQLRRPFPPEEQPSKLNDADALKLVRMIAVDSSNIVVIRHAQKRKKQRNITRPQIERCVQKGTITEGPFINLKGHWQMNLSRFTAGEQITCTIAIDWATKILVITTF